MNDNESGRQEGPGDPLFGIGLRKIISALVGLKAGLLMVFLTVLAGLSAWFWSVSGEQTLLLVVFNLLIFLITAWCVYQLTLVFLNRFADRPEN
jgi:hypothetical protein